MLFFIIYKWLRRLRLFLLLHHLFVVNAQSRSLDAKDLSLGLLYNELALLRNDLSGHLLPLLVASVGLLVVRTHVLVTESSLDFFDSEKVIEAASLGLLLQVHHIVLRLIAVDYLADFTLDMGTIFSESLEIRRLKVITRGRGSPFGVLFSDHILQLILLNRRLGLEEDLLLWRRSKGTRRHYSSICCHCLLLAVCLDVHCILSLLKYGVLLD